MNNLFFALFPDAEAAKDIEERARQLRSSHKLCGKLLARNRFHVSLQSVGSYAELPQSKVRLAYNAAEMLTAKPFDVTFERAESFSGSFGKSSLILSGNDGVTALKEFQHSLVIAMIKSGVRKNAGAKYEPHVTLLYDDRKIEEHPINPPIKWIVRDFALVQSLVGQTRYIILGRWPLQR